MATSIVVAISASIPTNVVPMVPSDPATGRGDVTRSNGTAGRRLDAPISGFRGAGVASRPAEANVQCAARGQKIALKYPVKGLYRCFR